MFTESFLKELPPFFFVKEQRPFPFRPNIQVTTVMDLFFDVHLNGNGDAITDCNKVLSRGREQSWLVRRKPINFSVVRHTFGPRVTFREPSSPVSSLNWFQGQGKACTG